MPVSRRVISSSLHFSGVEALCSLPDAQPCDGIRRVGGGSNLTRWWGDSTHVESYRKLR
jgi:hypothetical protein